MAGGDQYVGYDFGTGTATSTTISGSLGGSFLKFGNQYVGDDFGTGTATSTTIGSDGAQYVGLNSGTGTATARRSAAALRAPAISTSA